MVYPNIENHFQEVFFINKQTEQIKNKLFIEFSMTLEHFDLTPIEARLFTFLYLVQKPVTLDEMSDELGNSKTTMSNSVHKLLDANLIQRVWRKGVRKDLYVASSTLYKSFMQSYKNKWTDSINHQIDALKELKTDLTTVKHDKILENRLNEIITFHELLEQTFEQINPNMK